MLIGAPDALGMLAGVGLTAVYLAFAMAVVALATSVARGVLGAVGATVVALLLLPLAAVVDVVAEWSPSALLGALPELAGGGDAGGYLRPLATTLVSTVALLALAARRLRTREV